MSHSTNKTELERRKPIDSGGALSQAELDEMAEDLHACLQAMGISNSLNKVTAGVSGSGQNPEELFIKVVSQIPIEQLQQISGLGDQQENEHTQQKNEYQPLIRERRNRQRRRIDLNRYAHKMVVLAAILGSGYQVFDNTAEFAPSIVVERVRLTIMVGLLGGSLGGAWGWGRGEDTYERASY